MGISCSSACLPGSDPDHPDHDHDSDPDSHHHPHRNGSHPEEAAKVAHQKPPSQIAKVLLDFLRPRKPEPMADAHASKRAPAQYSQAKALDEVVSNRVLEDPDFDRILGFPRPQVAKELTVPPTNEAAYKAAREQVVKFEGALAFDYGCTFLSSELEKKANLVLQKVKELDIQNVYGQAPPRKGFGGQLHPRFYGDHFLSNATLIEDTQLYKIIRTMPKGAHLHIHFNSNLLPGVLINIAKRMPRMFITSDIPLVPGGDGEAFDRCAIHFSIMDDATVEKGGGKQNIFDPNYPSRTPMQFGAFLDGFEKAYEAAHEGKPVVDVDTWLRNKLVFGEEETYNSLQTADGAWEKFNGRTQMMKGLFNYETAYRRYTKLCLQEFVDDNIQYAEIRPNFMSTNQVWKDDGSGKFDNEGIVEIITSAYDKFQRTHKFKVLKGLKIIYCTPRSFTTTAVGDALEECFQFKKKWPDWIAGFDLVGEESKGQPLKAFVNEFLAFKQKCKDNKVTIPFLFHCGETLEIGGETDGNLIDALLLDSKRIAHGFALPRHPYVLEQMKQRNICVEVCPISNEILGLTPRVNGHSMYSLLASNVHCTISTDNSTLFRSRLSHDFYQTMAGKADMTLHGFRQLIEWSLEHSCLDDASRTRIHTDWEAMWNLFCKKVVEDYKHLLPEEPATDEKPATTKASA
ncbi:adenosine deaminase 2 [Podospora conica]|nr:adenosine deaminase 2 [Schizothecium conicum]